MCKRWLFSYKISHDDKKLIRPDNVNNIELVPWSIDPYEDYLRVVIRFRVDPCCLSQYCNVVEPVITWSEIDQKWS